MYDGVVPGTKELVSCCDFAKVEVGVPEKTLQRNIKILTDDFNKFLKSSPYDTFLAYEEMVKRWPHRMMELYPYLPRGERPERGNRGTSNSALLDHDHVTTASTP